MVRERQVPRLEEALAEQQRLLTECEAALAEAQAHHDDCTDREERALCERFALTSAAFRPDALMALDFTIDAMVAQSAQAAQALARCEAGVQAQEEAVAGARADIARNEERIQRFKERIAELQMERERAEEESADEESEEVAAARIHRRRGAQAAT